MATVMHGRRKGTPRGMASSEHAPGIQYAGQEQTRSAMQLADGTDLRQVTVLSKQDWERIQEQLNRRKIQQDRIAQIQADREKQKQRSEEIVSTWGNTIAGIRQKKLEARKIREKKEEEERVALDIEEAKVQARNRKEAIEKAKTQQYYQTDRVKRFHGALMLTEVLKERDAQVELKKLKDAAAKDQEMVYLNELQLATELGILADQEKAMERIKRTQDTQRCLVSQIQEHHHQVQEEQDRDQKEGQQLQQLAIDNHKEMQRLEDIRKEERKQLQLQNMTQIADCHRMRDLEKQQEEEEDEECRVFAAAKRKMMRMRAEKEKSIKETKLSQLDAIRSKLAAQMKQKADDEDERIRRAVEEKEAKRLKEDKEKEQLTIKRIAEATEHRMSQIRKEETRKREERLAELEALQVRQEADDIFRRNEHEKQMRRRQEALELAGFHKDQASERYQKEDEAFKSDVALAKANVELLELEEKQFQEYAQKVITHCEEGGRNTYPLRKAAQAGIGGGAGPVFNGKGGIRPSYMANDKCGVQMPHYQKDSTEDIKLQIQGKRQTKKRLGFVW